MTSEETQDMVRLASAATPFEAHIWEQALLEAGIRCRVLDDKLRGGVGTVPGVRSEIWVQDTQQERAEAILCQPAERNRDETAEMRDGSENADGLAWDAGAMRPRSGVADRAHPGHCRDHSQWHWMVNVQETAMKNQSWVIAFDLDRGSLISLQNALPESAVKVVNGASAASLGADWVPGVVDLLVVQSGEEIAETLELCKYLVSRRILAQPGPLVTDTWDVTPRALELHGDPPDAQRPTRASLLVLLPSGQMTHLRDVLKAGAHSCLALPINAKDVASMLVHAQAGNQPGRHTLNLERAQIEDRWRDDGGES